MQTWNIKYLIEQEVLQEVKERNIVLCAVQETKKEQGRNSIKTTYMLIYSCVEKQERAKEKVAFLDHNSIKYTKMLLYIIAKRPLPSSDF